ncbi:MAG TPA: potassium channel family protein, partial [bacterium]|nr:potassium channel family protein [bacterium]
MRWKKPADPTRRLYMALAIMLVIPAIGVTGYCVIEDWSLLDSIYMTVITLTTIGFQEVEPLSDAGRIFTIIIVTFSITALAYAVNAATRLLISGEIRNYMEQRRMRRSMEKMENHFIVCGFGRIGRRICELFIMEKVRCIV